MCSFCRFEDAIEAAISQCQQPVYLRFNQKLRIMAIWRAVKLEVLVKLSIVEFLPESFAVRSSFLANLRSNSFLLKFI